MFVELKKKEYYLGNYTANPTMFAIDDISRVVGCVDNCNLTNVITKDGTIHTIMGRYEDIVKKICDVERRQDETDRC